MKKFVLILFTFILFSISTQNSATAENDKLFYAKVQSTGVQLCSSPSEAAVMFELPYSYFVKVDYVVDDYFKVSYNNVEGYVKKDKVSLMNGIPQKAYADATFKLFVPYSLYETASQNSAITPLSESQTLNYYGTKIGQQVRSDNNIWYYTSVQINDEIKYGYVYSGVTDLLSQITVNTETFEIVSEDVFNATATSFTSLSTGTKIMLIVAISVPSLLILYFLIKPSKIMQITKTHKKAKKETRKIHHGDYFEFDENEL